MTDVTHDSPTLMLSGRHAIVTGAGHGLGRTIALALAGAGARVTLMGRDTARLDNVAAEIASHGGAVQPLRCDVTDPALVVTAFAAAASGLGVATILVNNAGQARSESFADTSLEHWSAVMDVNLTGPFLCTREVVGPMVTASDGRIVNIASTAALRGYATLSAYCASKHGLLGLTRSLAAEVARSGVTVNAVCPGYTEGGMSDQALQGLMTTRGVTADEALGMLVRRNPQRRLTTQEEVAETVLWLCSPGASAITGQAIAVAGGEVM